MTNKLLKKAITWTAGLIKHIFSNEILEFYGPNACQIGSHFKHFELLTYNVNLASNNGHVETKKSFFAQKNWTFFFQTYPQCSPLVKKLSPPP